LQNEKRLAKLPTNGPKDGKTGRIRANGDLRLPEQAIKNAGSENVTAE
jgi:hypothetical protein